MNIPETLNFMRRAHKGQLDKAGKPYWTHPYRVAFSIINRDAEVIKAALLHDVVEDTKYTLKDLAEAGFSEKVLKLVDYLTRDKNTHTFKEYIRRIADTEDAELIEIKLSDLVDNTDPDRAKGLNLDKLMKRYQWATRVLIYALLRAKRC